MKRITQLFRSFYLSLAFLAAAVSLPAQVIINSYTHDVVSQVTFQEAGAGVAVASAVTNLQAPLPVTGLQAGDIFFCQVGVQSTNSAVSTPAGWVLWIAYQSSSVGHQFIFYRRSDGTESGNVTIPMLVNVANVKVARVYRFRGGAGPDPFLGNGTVNLPGIQNSSVVNTTTINAPASLAGSAKSLGINFTYVPDDATYTAFTGSSGGTWTMPVAVYITTLGSDSSLGIQTTTFTSAGTISGGSTISDRSATYVQIAATLSSTNISVQASVSGRAYGGIGQSNLAGRGDPVNIVGRPELLLPIPRSYVWWYSNTTGWQWQQIQAGVNGDDVDGQFGPLISLSYAEHLKYPTVDKYYVWCGVGGTTVAQWNSTIFVRQFMHRYNAALQTLTPTVFAGYIWIQGENDALSAPLGAAYQAAESTLFTTSFSSTSFTNGTVGQLQNLPIGTFPGITGVQTAKVNNQAGAVYGPGGVLVIPPNTSNLHYSAMEYVTYGESLSFVLP